MSRYCTSSWPIAAIRPSRSAATSSTSMASCRLNSPACQSSALASPRGTKTSNGLGLAAILRAAAVIAASARLYCYLADPRFLRSSGRENGVRVSATSTVFAARESRTRSSTRKPAAARFGRGRSWRPPQRSRKFGPVINGWRRLGGVLNLLLGLIPVREQLIEPFRRADFGPSARAWTTGGWDKPLRRRDVHHVVHIAADKFHHFFDGSDPWRYYYLAVL